MSEQVKMKTHLEKLFDVLLEKKLTIGAVESISAGAFATKVVSIPGASKILKGSLVCYSEDCKKKFFKVSGKDIYSVETSKKLAQWATNHFESKIGLSIIGVAGPSKPHDDLKIGDLIISVDYKNKVKTYILNTGSDKRDVNSVVAVNLALQVINAVVAPKKGQPTTVEEQLNLNN